MGAPSFEQIQIVKNDTTCGFATWHDGTNSGMWTGGDVVSLRYQLMHVVFCIFRKQNTGTHPQQSIGKKNKVFKGKT